MSVVIVNTGCSNLSSIKLSIQKLGYNPIITSDPKIIAQSNKLFLPGVGSALSIMEQLSNKKIISVIKNYTFPILGICLGMQVLSCFSDESNGIKMLDIIHEPVKLLNTNNLPLPHTGWNKVNKYTGHPLFNGIKEDSWFYFIHSYVFLINKYTIAQSYYGSYFSAAVQRDNFFGVQFHPEKSGNLGLRLLLNFLEM